MNSLKLCQDDSLINLLRETFQANPIRLPEERIKPLTVLSIDKKNISFMGIIDDLLVDKINMSKLSLKNSKMADVSAQSSKSIKTSTGLKIMEGFFKGFGAKSSLIEHVFKNVTKVSFSFENVNREYFEKNALLKTLMNKNFSTSHAVNKSFISKKTKCVIIDSIITSNNFSIKAEEFTDNSFSFNIQELTSILSLQNNINVVAQNDKEVSFVGNISLPFAFTGFYLNIASDGSVHYENEPNRMFLTVDPYNTDESLGEVLPFINDEIALCEIV